MANRESDTPTELPYKDMQIYYSGSIHGAPELDPDFAWKLVQFVALGGANVLSEHVAGRTKDERDKVRAARTGQVLDDMLAHPEPWFPIRRQDAEWVDACTHFIAVVNAPSHGVGMEIERALLKPRLGLNETPILCLAHESLVNKLSYMIRGISKEEFPNFSLETYSDLASAQQTIDDFLRKTK